MDLNKIQNPRSGVYIYDPESNNDSEKKQLFQNTSNPPTNSNNNTNQSSSSDPTTRKQEITNEILNLLKELSSPSSSSLPFHQYEEHFFALKGLLETKLGFDAALEPAVFPYIQLGLQSEYEGLKRLALFHLQKCAENERDLLHLFDEQKMVQLWEILIGQSILFAEIVANVFVGLSRKESGLNLIFNSQSLPKWKKYLMSSSESVIKFRLLSIITRIAVISAFHFSFIEKIEFLDILNSIFKSQDVLEILNAVELLDNLSKAEHTSKYLEQSKVLEKLFITLGDQNDPFGDLLKPRILGFFGEFFEQGAFQRHIVLNNPLFFQVLTKIFQEEEHGDLLGASISAVSRLGSHPEGIERLVKVEKKLIQSYLGLLDSLGETRVIFLNGFAYLLKRISRFPESEDIHSQINEYIPHLFTTLFGILPSPIESVQNAAFSVIDSLVHSEWGILEMLKISGFYEYLTNRSLDVSKKVHEWKYGIVTTMYKSGEKVLSENQKMDFEKYIKMGVMFVKPESFPDIEYKNQ